MPITTISSREFNQDVGLAKKAAQNGPVVITDRGEPSHVLLSIKAYRKFLKKRTDIVTALAMPAADAATLAEDFEPPKSNIRTKAADLSS
jgi:prevent-host-death family protein